ncbi:MAG: hypothetical protein KC731_36895, partial [Myxococcales bacterium]|nr:hypothetical protein [Myxococcales bacterium]
MSGDLVVGVDSSTTAVKAIAWNAAGEAVAEGRASLTLDNPSPGAWEQDAEAWWSAFVVACASLTEQLDPSRLCALGITHQRETVVVTDGAGRPRAPALTWMDARATAQVDAARAALGAEQLLAISGKSACTTQSFYKLAWLFETRPELARGERRVLDVHGFLCWRLTGRCATSLAAADPLGLVDMQARAWSASLAAHLGLALGELAELVEPGTVIGGVSEAAARATGLPAGLPVVAGAGDGQCAGLGAGIRAPGRAYLNLGTAIVSGVLGESYRTSTAFRTLYDATGAHYFFETDLQGGTFTITWLVDLKADLHA